MRRPIPTPLELIESAKARLYQASDSLNLARDSEQIQRSGEELRASIQNYLKVVPTHVRENEDPIITALTLNYDNIMGVWE